MRTLIKTAFLAILIAGCGSGGGDDAGGGTKPTAASLISPINNTECLTATSVSATESNVTFEWNPADNADTYSIYVKNLKTQTQLQYNAGVNTSMIIKLLKGVPYSWYVTSKSNATSETGTSAVWKFYNAGDGIISYIPFPADLVAPAMSSTVEGPTINLQWNGEDIDNDIVEYKVYMDTNNNPTTLKGTVTTEFLNQVSVTAGTSYYWKVVTKDGAGNTATSPVFQFKTF